MTKKTWQEQMLGAVGKTVSEQLLNNEKLREAVTREVINTVGRAASKAGTGSKAADKGAGTQAASGNPQAVRGDVASQMREIWEHPTVQGAVKGGLSTVSEQARQWQASLSGKVQQRADERLQARLSKQQEKGQSVPAEVAEQLAQRQREREEQQLTQQLREGLLAQAANAAQRQVLQRVFESTPWLGGRRGPLRYTELVSELGLVGELGGAGATNAQRQMEVHSALWALAEQKVLAVQPHGEIELLPEAHSPEAHS